MAKVRIKKTGKKKVVLTLSEKEASVVLSLVGNSIGPKTLHNVFDALDDASTSFKFKDYEVDCSGTWPVVSRRK